MTETTRRRLLAGAALLPFAGAARAQQAQAWPTKPIRVVLPGPAGGIIDVGMRTISEALAADLGQQIVIDPRPGGNGIVAGQIVTGAPRDGYTLEATVSAHYGLPFLMKAPFDVVEDFTPIAMVGVTAAVLCVAKSMPVRSVDELVAYASKASTPLTYLNSGNGTSTHLVPELLKIEKKIDLVSVPYKGLPPGVQDLLGERIQIGLVSAPLILGHVKSGAVVPIAVSGATRLPEIPNVPTLREQGYGAIEIQSALPLLGPKGLPDPIVQRLNASVAKALADPQVRARLEGSYIQPTPMTVAEVQAWARAEYDRLGKLIVSLGIKADGG